MNAQKLILDANEAVARVAYATNEVIAIYPITPSSPMGEYADAWMAKGQPNIWGSVPAVIEMESEMGAAGAVHGSLLAGSLTTTFTASQGLLLMIPNMYKIAGELTPFVMHVAARSLATHALSIFGDHSDVMAARTTGFALLCSASVQEAQDFALVSQAASLASRIPFIHFFDGFRTSHEISSIEGLSDETILDFIDEKDIYKHRERALNSENPSLRGTAQNPDVFFQAREAVNAYYRACPQTVQEAFDRFAEATGRQYRLFDYFGAPDAERIIVVMGSGGETVEEVVEKLNAEGEKVGLVKVRLMHPFSVEDFVDALPGTVNSIAVLDRSKEPGAVGEPLYLEIVAAISEAMSVKEAPFEWMPRVIGGRFGLSSKEFTPAMVYSVFQELKQENPRNHFTVGINDDVTHTSLPVSADFSTASSDIYRAVFYGLGADGTVGASKNSIKIIGEHTDKQVQAYFVYDSKKSGSMTVSHLRFGPRHIRAHYLIQSSDFIGVHQWQFIERLDVLQTAKPGSTVLINSPYSAEETWERMPTQIQSEIVGRELRVYTIDAYDLARKIGLGRRINTIMQAGFFALGNVLDRAVALDAIRKAIRKTYAKAGDTVVEKNLKVVEEAVAKIQELNIPDKVSINHEFRSPISGDASGFVRDVIGKIIAGEGDALPVSSMPSDGRFPTGTTQYEKRGIAREIPVWMDDLCIQCGKCVMACPHAAIRGKLYIQEAVAEAPESFKRASSKWPDRKFMQYSLQVSPEDCTGCHICAEVCPVRDKKNPDIKALMMQDIDPLLEQEKKNWDYFQSIPDYDATALDKTRVKDLQLVKPMFEFSGACSGCGETPYLKLLTQLFGDRMMVANATGCSSIFGGNLPTTPWAKDADGHGPAWANSLFEDNAEFGLGMRISLDEKVAVASTMLRDLESEIGTNLVVDLLEAEQRDDKSLSEQRQRIRELRERLTKINDVRARRLESVADALLRRSVWIIGGDGWAYDIGYGGLDHVIASGRNVNILVLDTEVYSNTGGQASKATPRAAHAKFAASGKASAKKDLALLAMTYGSVYVARVAMGANDAQTIKAIREAENYDGPSLVIAYSHCMAHGFDLGKGFEHQKAAVESGHWPLMRFLPDLVSRGESPLKIDSKPPKISLEEYIGSETRFRAASAGNAETTKHLLEEAQLDIQRRWKLYEYLANFRMGADPTEN